MRALLVVSILALAASAARAQPAEDAPGEPAPAAPEPATTGTIEGTVEAPDLDAPLAGATITLVGTTATATTDDEGKFSIVAPPRAQNVRAEFTGFKSEAPPTAVCFALSLRVVVKRADRAGTRYNAA